MSILTKEDRNRIEKELNTCTLAALGVDDTATIMLNLYSALDTIDALERTIKGIERATTMQQVETVLIAARAFGVIEGDEE